MKKQADHAEVIAVGWSAFLMKEKNILHRTPYSAVEAGIKKHIALWIPAFAGMTRRVGRKDKK